MDYTRTDDIPYFADCAPAAGGEGLVLLELQVEPRHGMVHVSAVIASPDPAKDISVEDCSKVHHALAPKLLSLLGKTEDELSMEVSSPGLERRLKDAYEFSILAGRKVRVWDRTLGDWRSGVIGGADGTGVTLVSDDGGSETVAYEDIAKAKLLNT